MKKEAKCDGNNDCGDFSDEAACGDCGPNRFRCRNGPCVDGELACDGKPDCKGSSINDVRKKLEILTPSSFPHQVLSYIFKFMQPPLIP